MWELKLQQSTHPRCSLHKRAEPQGEYTIIGTPIVLSLQNFHLNLRKLR